MFFPERGGGVDSQEAKKVCGECPVSEECLDYALHVNDGFGIYGGLTATERRRLNRVVECGICDAEFPATAPNQRYCSAGWR